MVKMKIALALLASLFSVATASAQGPGGGPQPPPSGWTQNGSQLYPTSGGCVTIPQAVAGGCMGNGTLNVTSLYAGIETINALSNATGSGLSVIGLNSALPLDYGYAVAPMLGLFQAGSAANPITTYLPVVLITRVENITTCPACSDLSGQAALSVVVQSTSQFQSNGIKATVLTNPNGGVKADNVAVYAAAQMSNTLTSPPSNAFALFAVAETTVNGNGAFAFQGGTINNGGNYPYDPTSSAALLSVGLDIASESASNYLSTAAIDIRYAGSQYDVGIGFLTDGTNNGSSPSTSPIKTAAIQDDSDSITSYYIHGGAHTNGINLNGGTYSGHQINGIGFNVGPSGTITVTGGYSGSQSSNPTPPLNMGSFFSAVAAGNCVTHWQMYPGVGVGLSTTGFNFCSSSGQGFNWYPNGGALGSPVMALSSAGAFNINVSGAAVPTPQTGTIVQLENVGSTITRVELDATAASSHFSGARQDGTPSSPTALLSGDEIVSINALGFNSLTNVGPYAAFRCYAYAPAAGNWSATVHGTYCDVAVTAGTASAAMTEAIRFENDGGITIPSGLTGGDKGAGTLNAGGLYVNGVAVLSNTPAALTASNDTNVTLTLGGTPSTALLQAASITAGWSGQLALTRGGSNASLTASNGGIVWSNSTQLQILAGTATANLPLLSGSSATPAWASVAYLTSTATSGGIPYFSSTTQMATSALLAANAIMIGGGSGTAPSTTTTGSGVLTAIGNGVNTNGGILTGTTSSVAAGALRVGAGSGTAATGVADVAAGSVLISGGVSTAPSYSATPTLGASGTAGSIAFGNATSGTVTLQTVAGALGTVTASLPANTGTIAELNFAQTWSAVQTYNTGDLAINGGTATAGLASVTSGGVVSSCAACTLATSLTNPLDIGGSGTTGTQKTFQTTTGAGTTDAFAFKGGNNGATTFGSWNSTALTMNSGQIDAGANFGGALATLTGLFANNGAANSYLWAGQDATHGILFTWLYNATAASASATLQTYGNSNALGIDGSSVNILTGSGNNLGVGTTTTVATFNGTTAALSKTTGALVVAGGVGIGGTIYVGGLANAATTSAVCYNTSSGLFTYDGTIGSCNTSSMRFKHDIRPLNPEQLLAGVMQMRPDSFEYNADQNTPGQQLGLMAEELEAIDPRLVGYDQEGKPNSIRFLGPMTVYMIGAVKELKAENDNLKVEVERLRRRASR